ncbi:MAG: hypothetical protein HFJ45_10085 [Clostridia bacterium]|nr:hypothetical protein [Clostridia bacterium]
MEKIFSKRNVCLAVIMVCVIAILIVFFTTSKEGKISVLATLFFVVMILLFAWGIVEDILCEKDETARKEKTELSTELNEKKTLLRRLYIENEKLSNQNKDVIKENCNEISKLYSEHVAEKNELNAQILCLQNELEGLRDELDKSESYSIAILEMLINEMQLFEAAQSLYPDLRLREKAREALDSGEVVITRNFMNDIKS